MTRWQRRWAAREMYFEGSARQNVGKGLMAFGTLACSSAAFEIGEVVRMSVSGAYEEGIAAGGLPVGMLALYKAVRLFQNGAREKEEAQQESILTHYGGVGNSELYPDDER